MAESILIEVAVESVACAVAAVRAGAARLELCADLARGGVTPSAGMIRAVREAVDVPLMILVRPRPGNFVYSGVERAVMRHDIHEAHRAGANGVVFGALMPAACIDAPVMEGLITAAATLEVVMHRAVDQVPDLLAALQTLMTLGVRRVLSSGGAPNALAGAERLASMVRTSGERLAIMPGGQVRADNVSEILRRTGAGEIHLGPRRAVGGAGMGTREELDIEQVAAVVCAVRALGEP